MSDKIGVAAWPSFFRLSTHSTAGKSRYSIASQRIVRCVTGSRKVTVIRVRSPSSGCASRVRFQPWNIWSARLPPYMNEKKGSDILLPR